MIFKPSALVSVMLESRSRSLDLPYFNLSNFSQNQQESV